MRFVVRLIRPLLACSVLLAPNSPAAGAQTRFRVRVLIANKPEYHPDLLDPNLVNAWGLAIRPAGFGGHFWVANYGHGTSDEYVGDVGSTPLYQDNLKVVAVPNSAPNEAGPTGVVFNQFGGFVVTQSHSNGPITAPAKFLFATDNGTVSAWTERATGGGDFDRPGEAVTVLDRSARGSAFFGLTLDATGTKLFCADFGLPAGIRVYDAQFRDITPRDKFLNPWAIPRDRRNLTSKPGLFTPFNVQMLALNDQSSLFVPYIKTKPLDDHPWVLERAEEDSGPGKGRLAQFDFNGNLIARWLDRGFLNAPWGVSVAPANFGVYNGMLLVGNFGDGTIVAFNPRTRRAVDYLRDASGVPIVLPGLWGILPGNGASLGEAFRLYFAAGPDEVDGLFGYVEAIANSSGSLGR
jgi:uncharacterized protein (TIGR03118 family)